MEIHVKKFHELTPDEMYDILKLRVDVFVVEQQCTSPELDGRDQDAIHVWITDEDGVQAYLRILAKGVEHPDYPAIGRVLTSETKRSSGYGRAIMEEGIRVLEKTYGAVPIYLEAQTYAEGFYGKFGFRKISEEFILDGLPHYKMLRESAIEYECVSDGGPETGADDSEAVVTTGPEAATKENFRIVEGMSQIRVEDVARLLKTTYWAGQRPVEKIEKSIRHSDCYGIYLEGEPRLVGFARVITDYATTFYLADVIIDEEHRGDGLGKELVSYILSRPKYAGLRGILVTKDAHGLYEKYGFERQDGRFMSRSAK